MYVHALHNVHAVPDWRSVGGRLGGRRVFLIEHGNLLAETERSCVCVHKNSKAAENLMAPRKVGKVMRVSLAGRENKIILLVLVRVSVGFAFAGIWQNLVWTFNKWAKPQLRKSRSLLYEVNLLSIRSQAKLRQVPLQHLNELTVRHVESDKIQPYKPGITSS